MQTDYRDLARCIDVSCVKTGHTRADIDRMAETARRCGFVCAFALPGFTSYLIGKLRGSGTKVGGTIGFPSGGSTAAAKVFEARELVGMGCDELDMVVNVGRLRSGDDAAVRDEIAAVVAAVQGRPVKAILEVSLLTDDEIAAASRAAVAAGAAYIKTGTGWMAQPAAAHAVRLIRETVGDRARIKAAGGIRDLRTLLELRRAGCDRFGIGTQHAVSILREAGAPS